MGNINRLDCNTLERGRLTVGLPGSIPGAIRGPGGPGLSQQAGTVALSVWVPEISSVGYEVHVLVSSFSSTSSSLGDRRRCRWRSGRKSTAGNFAVFGCVPGFCMMHLDSCMPTPKPAHTPSTIGGSSNS